MSQSAVKKTKLKEKLKNMSPTRMIVLSFLLLILLGALLLSLPFATKVPAPSFIDRLQDGLFTATSATCVTGLVLADTYQHWTPFGQAVIIILIQCGGLGIATFATAFTLLVRQKLGIRFMSIATESSGASFVNVKSLVKLMVGFTFACEAVGAMLLMLRFIPLYGIDGIWPAVFIAISGYCNAGFDVLGFVPGNTNLSAFAEDPLVSLVVAGLIIIGGLGFIVVQEIYHNKFQKRFHHQKAAKLGFHSKVCLIMTASLLIIGTVGFYIFEFNASLAELSPLGKVNASFFQSTSARTAGFATVNIGEESEFGKMLTILLMFVGACPGSTAGGIKVTTAMVLLATVICTIKGRHEVTAFRHRLPSYIINKSLAVMLLAFVIVFVDAVIIVSLNGGVAFLDALYEAVSAFGTVGLSVNLTPSLDRVSQFFLILTMFIGRIGPASFGLSIMMRHRSQGESILPEGKMLIG